MDTESNKLKTESKALSEDAKFSALQVHYHDTWIGIIASKKARDWLYLLVVALASLFVYQVASPREGLETIGQVISSKFGTAKIDLFFLNNILWFILLGSLIKYFQAVDSVNRGYDYIDSLELLLAGHFVGGVAFTREGHHYKKSETGFTNWAFLVYTFVSPIILGAISLYKIYLEWENYPGPYKPPEFSILFNSIMCLAVCGTIGLRFFLLWKKNK